MSTERDLDLKVVPPGDVDGGASQSEDITHNESSQSSEASETPPSTSESQTKVAKDNYSTYETDISGSGPDILISGPQVIKAHLTPQNSEGTKEVHGTPVEDHHLGLQTAAATSLVADLTCDSISPVELPRVSFPEFVAGRSMFQRGRLLTEQDERSYIELKNASPFTRNYSAWLPAATTTTITIIALAYSWNAMIPSVALHKILWNDPQITIFTVNLLSHLTTLLVDHLVMTANDNLRWKLCSRREGISLLNFLALAGSTSFVGLIQLFFSPRSRVRDKRPNTERQSGFRARLWTAQRLFILLLKFILGFVLLINLNVDPTFMNATDKQFEIPAGVVPINGPGTDNLEKDYDVDIRRLVMLTSMGKTITGKNERSHEGIKFMLNPDDEDSCPRGMDCSAFFLLRQLNFSYVNGIQNPVGQSFIRSYKTPFYHIYIDLGHQNMSFRSSFNASASQCRMYYGSGGRGRWLVCASTKETEYGKSLVIGHGLLQCPLGDGDSCTVHMAKVFPLHIRKRYGDLTYSMRNGSLISMENLSQNDPVYEVDPNYYLKSFDLLYTARSKKDEYFVEYLFAASVQNFEMLKQGRLVQSLELFLLPFTHSQRFYEPAPEPIVNVSFLNDGYRVSPSPNSIYAFTAFILVILLWCLGLLIAASVSRTPQLSSFPELDLISRLPADSQLDNDELQSVLSKISRTGRWGLAGVIGKVRLFAIEEEGEIRNDAEEYELATRG